MRSPLRLAAWWLLGGLAAMLVIGLLVGQAMGQDGHGQDHAQHHDWYQHLKQPSNPHTSCCSAVNGNQGDCRPVRAYFDSDAGLWMAFVDGRWEPVPPQVVIKDDSLNHEPFTAHACKSKSGVWYCFLRKQAGG